MIHINIPFRNFIDRGWPLALFCLLHAVILLWLFQSGMVYNKLYIMRSGFDTCEYYYASQFAEGYLPYRDFSVEYPPITMIFIILPKLIVSSFNAYIWVYAAEVLLFDLAAAFLLAVLSREVGYNPWKTLGIYTIALIAIGPLTVTRLDFIPAILTLLSVFFFVKSHHKTGWAFLAVATLTKVYPAVIAPVFFLIQMHRKQKNELFEGLAVFVITTAIIAAPFILMSERGLWDSFLFHTQRPLQIESTYASIIELLYAFKVISLDFSNSFNSLVISGTVPDMLAKISFGVTVLSLLAVYRSLFRSLKKGPGNEKRAGEISLTIRYCLISILVFILTCKVFSPQYIIWLLPLVPLIRLKQPDMIWILFVIAGIMTFFVYPQYYDGIRNGSVITISLLVARNLVLVGITVLLLHDRFLKPQSYN